MTHLTMRASATLGACACLVLLGRQISRIAAAPASGTDVSVGSA
jgi:hypothetical protein